MEELFVEIVKKWRAALALALNIPEGLIFVKYINLIILKQIFFLFT